MRPLVLTPGDPRGIGPEVAAKALVGWAGRPVVIAGDAEAFRAEARRVGLRLADGGAAGVQVVEPAGSGPVEIRALRWAVDRCLSGDAAGLVTGPIHKARLAARGFHHAGHTQFLGELCGVERPVMAFVGGHLRVALVTVHLPLAQVPAAVTRDAVVHTLRTADAALREQLRVARPRLLVCGLNPHAGDQGLLGSEEAEVIAPAVADAVAAGVDAVGPISAEAAFRAALAGQGDMVVAMYHDQGLAPLKAVDFGRSVNWTLGLPIVRTSVDHGTGDDIAGRGVADPASMLAALTLADELARG